MVTKFKYVFAVLAASTAIAAVSMPAGAQMFEGAYQNNSRDGLSSAVIMKQVDSGMFGNNNSGLISGGGGTNGDVLLCGSDESTASATANSSCIIIGDGATAIIDMGQGSDGDQTATTDSTTNVEGDLSDALEALNGG